MIKLFQNVLELNNSSEDLERFVKAIASKKGTTQAGVKYLKSQNIKKTIYTTLDRAYKRAKELSVEKKSTKKKRNKANEIHLNRFFQFLFRIKKETSNTRRMILKGLMR